MDGSNLGNPGWTVQYKLPNGWTIAGRSRAAESTGFYLIEPGISLDAGLPCRKWDPTAILITHTHLDHAGALPQLLRGIKFSPTILAPQSLVKRLYQWVKDSWAITISENDSVPF